MLLKSISIRDLAGIGSVDFAELDPGLNVVVGDNEAGKSTVLTALRAAIFHRHGSSAKVVKDLAPYGRQVRPAVDIAFDIAGTPYRLEKRFLQKPEARLVWPGGEIVGEAVEDRLAELFGFSPFAGRGDFDTEKHQGAFGLLWVEQGRSAGGLDIGAGRDAIAASLEAEVGQILGGERGRELIAAAKRLRDRHFTETGAVRKNSELKGTEDELAALDRALSEAREMKRILEGRIDRLHDRRMLLARYERDAVLEKAQAALTAAETAERAREDRRRDLTEAAQGLEIAAAAVERAVLDLKAREDLAASLEAAEAAARSAGEALAESRGEAARLGEALGPLATEREVAARLLRRIEEDHRTGERRREKDRLQARLQTLEATLGQSRQAADCLQAARGRLAALSLDETSYRGILDADTRRREAAIGREAAAPSIRFHPDGPNAVSLDGEPVAPGRAVKVARLTSFRLEGFGRVEIAPDAGSRERDAAYENAAAALDALLRRAGIESVEAAHEARRRMAEAEAEAREAAAELKARAPQGVAALEEERRELQDCLAAFADLASDGPHDAADLWAELASARRRLQRAEAAFESHRGEADRAGRDLIRLEAAAEGAAHHAERLRSALGAAEAAATLPALTERLAAAEVARRAQAVMFESRKAAYAAADPEAIELELGRARKALHHLQRDVSAVEAEVRELEAEIRVTGGQGIGEEIERMDGERAELDARLMRLRREADASVLLLDTLRRAEARARETWFAPIRQEVAPFLRLVHPESDVALDDRTLAITGLSRRGVEEEFRRLSTGAREQVAVVTRLALANVLKKGGHPATVILDDALVNTDEKRLGRMHLVLQRAAETLQIVVLTCRERDFEGLGARIHRL